MKNATLSLLFLALPAALAAQTPPVRPPAPPAPPARAADTVPAPKPATQPAEPAQRLGVDRIVAVVGTEAILQSELEEEINRRRGDPNFKMPSDSAGIAALERSVLNELVDAEVLVQKGKADKIEVVDADIERTVDKDIARIRGSYKSDQEYRDELAKAGFGTPEEYRRKRIDQSRRGELQRGLMEKLKKDGKFSPAVVSEADVKEAFDSAKGTIPKREPTIGLRQIIIAPKPTAAAKAAARAKADSLATEIRKGGDFEQIAKRESMDQGTKELGGDLGWNRRGVMVPEFDRMMFGLPPNVISPIVETAFGYHIIRVDRVQPAEVKARHILIRPKIDSADVERARLEADSVYASWKGGASYDSLLAKHHDARSGEESNLPPFPRAQLPASYAKAVEEKKVNDLMAPFAIDDPTNKSVKYVVAQVTSLEEGGERTLDEMKSMIREQLQQERGIRRLIDSLRKQTYVSVRLDQPALASRPNQ
jgi:peptidyl-prolyl cis-trans isomerase SurA